MSRTRNVALRTFGSVVTGAVVLLMSTIAEAGPLTATVETLYVNPTLNKGYLRLTGAPTFDGGSGCTSTWAAGNLDDQNFMVYIWPLLMSAKNNGKSVTVNVTGCIDGYPHIEWAQVNAT
jgi:hypothetical protein